MLSDNYPPYNMVNDHGDLIGFNIEILNAIMELSELDVEVSYGNWKVINNMLEEGKIDAIAGEHYPGTPDDEYSYTRSVISTAHALIYNSRYNSLFSIEKLRTADEPVVVMWRNKVLQYYVTSINPNAKFRYVENYEDMLDALDNEDVFCGFGQRVACMYFADLLNKDYIRSSSLNVLERNMGFKVSSTAPELEASLNAGLEVILSNGTYEEIYNRWILNYLTEKNWWQTYNKYLLPFIIILVSILFILLLVNYFLNKRVKDKTQDLEEQLLLNSAVMRELEKQKKKAEASDKMKSTFLANMSHEIRTPMNGILGFTELLKSQDFTREEQKRFIDLIWKSGDRMLATINNIIDISKIEAGVEEVRISEVNLSELINELSNFFTVEAQQKGLDLKFEAELIEDTTLFTDLYKLNAILTNLIKNALKFTDQGFVRIGYSLNSEYLQISVKDSGIGIPQTKQKMIFSQFVQAENTSKRSYEGSGLGLSITKAYLDLLGGGMKLDSEEKKGTEFIIQIPNKVEIKIPSVKSVEPQESKKLKKFSKIIIAEDDTTSVDYLNYILKNISEKILHAKNGVEAVQLFKDNPDTDLILMDVRMPEMSGLEATQKIREFNKEIYIIAQTAYAHAGYKAEALNAGCNDYITKPVIKENLMEKIRKFETMRID